MNYDFAIYIERDNLYDAMGHHNIKAEHFKLLT